MESAFGKFKSGLFVCFVSFFLISTTLIGFAKLYVSVIHTNPSLPSLDSLTSAFRSTLIFGLVPNI